MKWFDRWFYSKVRWANVRAGYEFSHLKEQEDILDNATEMYHSPVDHDSEVMMQTTTAGGDSDAHDLYDGIRIDVKRLTGGYVVTFRHPYSKRSQNMNYIEDPTKNSYIIKEDDDFNDTLGKLLTMELLK
jgi:hypothetical protein